MQKRNISILEKWVGREPSRDGVCPHAEVRVTAAIAMKKKIFASSVSRSTSGRSGSLSRGLLSDFPSAARVRWTAGRAVALALVLSVATVLVMLSISSHRRDSGEKRHWKDYEYVMSVGRATEVRATSAGHEAGWAPCARAGNQHSFAFVAAEADGDGDEGRRSRERCSLGSKFGHTAHMEAPDATGRLGFRNHEARVNGSTKLLGKWALARSLLLRGRGSNYMYVKTVEENDPEEFSRKIIALLKTWVYSAYELCHDEAKDVSYVRIFKSGNNAIRGNLGECEKLSLDINPMKEPEKAGYTFTFVRHPIDRFVSAYNEAEFRWVAERASASGNGVQHEQWHSWEVWKSMMNGTEASNATDIIFSPTSSLPPVGTEERAMSFVKSLLRLDWIGHQPFMAQVKRAVNPLPVVDVDDMILATLDGVEDNETRVGVEDFILDNRHFIHPGWRVAPEYRLTAALNHVLPQAPCLAMFPVDFVGHMETFDDDWNRLQTIVESRNALTGSQTKEPLPDFDHNIGRHESSRDPYGTANAMRELISKKYVRDVTDARYHLLVTARAD